MLVVNIPMSVISGILGLAVGWLVPTAAQKSAEYKFRKLNRNLIADSRYVHPLFKAGMALLNGGGWAAIGLFTSNPVSSALMCLIWTLALIIAIVDIRIRIIPNEAILLLAPLGLLFQLTYFGAAGIVSALFSMVIVMLLFSVLAGFMGRSAVGAGDVKLAGAMSLVLGYPYILHGLFAMSIVMLIYIVAGLITKKLTMKSYFPFAPFMMAGLSAALIFIAAG
jgi:leader peptidase (prepilin peptidase)/N-methyltransferase